MGNQVLVHSNEIRLLAVRGNAAGTEFVLAGSVVRLGRGGDNDIVLDDTNCSRSHAELIFERGSYRARDLGSRNGIYVNGQKISEVALKDGDLLRLGDTGFRYAVFDGPAEPTGEALTGGNSSLFFLALGLLVAGVVLFVLLGGGSRSSSSLTLNPAADTDFEVIGLNQLFDDKTAGVFGGSGVAVSRNAQTVAKKSAPKSPDTQGGGAGSEQGKKKEEAQWIFQDAQRADESGRLLEAREGYARAIELDPACGSCEARLSRVKKQIQGEIQKNLRDARRFLGAGRYKEAQESLEVVLMLDPDTDSPYHISAKAYLNQAREKGADIFGF